MNPINLLIHCDLEAVPMKHLPAIWSVPAADVVMALDAGRSIKIVHRSPPCLSHSVPLRRACDLAGAK